MDRLQITKKEIDLSEFKLRRPTRRDFDVLIQNNTLIEIEGELPILYMRLENSPSSLINACKNINYYESVRTGGLKTNSALIGYKPRNPKKDNFCSMASTGNNFPIEHDVFLNYSEQLAGIYKHYFPEIYTRHMEALKQQDKAVLDDYILKETPFTSGIINNNNPLKYHTDTGNVENTLSAMVVIKNDVSGGYLSLPEYGIGFELCNNSVFFFNGQRILHGVTPINHSSKYSYRYSAVFYTLQDMWRCLPIDQELERYRKIQDAD